MLRKLFVLFVILLSIAALADKHESVDTLKTEAQRADAKKKIELYTKIAEQQLVTLDQAYSAGENQQARLALADVATYSVNAAQLAAESGKKMKHTEITLRKMSARLDAIRKNLDVDERPPVADAIQKMENARSALLDRMFRK